MTEQRITPKRFRWVGLAIFALIVIALVVVPNNSRLFAEPAGTVTVRFNQSTRAAPVNGFFTMQVVAAVGAQMDPDGLGAAEADVVYDPTYLEASTATDAGGLGSTGRTVRPLGPIIDNGAGEMAWGLYSYHETTPLTPGPNGTVSVENVKFKAQRAGVTALDLNNVLLTDVQARAWPDAGAGRNVNVSGAKVWNIIDAFSYCVFENAAQPGTHFDCVDFDGDGQADPATWVPATRWFKWKKSGDGYTTQRVRIGPASAIPLVGDFDGDGQADPATWDPATRWFKWKKSGSGYTVVKKRLGPATAIPLAADFDGDGKADPATWDPATKWFKWKKSGTSYTVGRVRLGPSGAVPAD